MPAAKIAGMLTPKLAPLLILVSLVSAAQAQDSASRAFFTKTYSRLNALTLKKDTTGLEKLFRQTSAPNFRYVDAHGKAIDGKALMQQMKMQLGMVKDFKRSTTKIERVSFKGNQATVRVLSDYAMTMPGEKGKIHVLTGKSVSDDLWVKSGAAWKLKQIKIVKEAATLDGKKMPGM